MNAGWARSFDQDGIITVLVEATPLVQNRSNLKNNNNHAAFSK